MSTVIETPREVEVVKETDVIVLGGGLAGIAAAVAAARNGVKVTLIEKYNVLGGLATAGHVCIYLPIDDGYGNKTFGGLAEELLHVSIKYGYDNLPDVWRSKPMTVPKDSPRYRTNFNIPAAILAYDELCRNEGVDLVFDTVFSTPIMDGNTVKGIVVENKSGRTAYMAKMFIDSTGDSDLLYRAGADTVDTETIVSTWAHELDFETMKAGIEKNDMIDAYPLRWFGLRPDVNNKNAVIKQLNGTKADDVNEYVKITRGLLLDHLKENQRESYAYGSINWMNQFRMTRHLVGKEALDINAQKPCTYVEHSIGVVSNPLDGPAACWEFPYEALITEKLTNVAAAGRMVSVKDFENWQFIRSIPGCVLTGEAAGTAAAVAVKNGTDLLTVDVAEVQSIMAKAGNIIHCTPEMEKPEEVIVQFGKKMGGNAKKNVGTQGVKMDSLSYKDGEKSEAASIGRRRIYESKYAAFAQFSHVAFCGAKRQLVQ